jgi:hypothetical protein
MGTVERAHRKSGKVRKASGVGARGVASNADSVGRGEPPSREAAKRGIVVHRLPSGRAHPINLHLWWRLGGFSPTIRADFQEGPAQGFPIF